KEDVVKRLAALSYDLERFSERTWNHEPVYVIGAAAGDTVSNQIWVDKKNLCVVRNITHLSPYEVLDMRVESRIPSCGGFLETRVGFYINGRLDQLEEYNDIAFNPKIDPAVFDPAKFGTVHWKKNSSSPKSH
ncbi:MAG TPA: hypothetical protein VGO45_12775, partial [Bacteroidia bacterium]|nr:hypothetical protein [Bacteroidia bacterium]